MTKTYLLLFFLLITSAVFTLYKLDHRSFFTDELVYFYSGEAIFKLGDFSLNTEVPPLGKYMAGVTQMLGGRSVFLLRTPFALTLLLSGLVTFFIIKSFLGSWWALFGSAVLLWSPFIFTETRMLMLEGPLLLLWLLFHLNFLLYIKHENRRHIVLAGVFFGLALATKIPSILLAPFSLLAIFVFKYIPARKIANRDLMDILSAGLALFASYFIVFLPQLIVTGAQGYLSHVKSIYDDYFVLRDQKGKIHFINDIAFIKSPVWYYFHFIIERYNPLLLEGAAIAPFSAFVQKSLFSYYWLLFLLISFSFNQVLGVKQVRYIAYFELPLVFLVVVLVYEIHKRFERTGKLLAVSLVLTLFLSRVAFAITETPTGYNALYKHMAEKTANFTNGERIYVFGSIRSSRWYFFGLQDNLFVSRKEQLDWEILDIEINTFRYLIFDKFEIMKEPETPFYAYARNNANNYDISYLNEFEIYTLKEAGARL